MFLRLSGKKSCWKVCIILLAIALAAALSLLVWTFVLAVGVEAFCRP